MTEISTGYSRNDAPLSPQFSEYTGTTLEPFSRSTFPAQSHEIRGKGFSYTPLRVTRLGGINPAFLRLYGGSLDLHERSVELASQLAAEGPSSVYWESLGLQLFRYTVANQLASSCDNPISFSFFVPRDNFGDPVSRKIKMSLDMRDGQIAVCYYALCLYLDQAVLESGATGYKNLIKRLKKRVHRGYPPEKTGSHEGKMIKLALIAKPFDFTADAQWINYRAPLGKFLGMLKKDRKKSGADIASAHAAIHVQKHYEFSEVRLRSRERWEI